MKKVTDVLSNLLHVTRNQRVPGYDLALLVKQERRFTGEITKALAEVSLNAAGMYKLLRTIEFCNTDGLDGPGRCPVCNGRGKHINFCLLDYEATRYEEIYSDDIELSSSSESSSS